MRKLFLSLLMFATSVCSGQVFPHVVVSSGEEPPVSIPSQQDFAACGTVQTDGTISWNVTISTEITNGIYIIDFDTYYNGTLSVSTITADGNACSLVKSQGWSDYNKHWQYYYKAASITTGAKTISIEMSAACEVFGVVTVYKDVNQTTPLGTAVSINLSSPMTLVSATNELIHGSLSYYNQTPVDDSGQTRIGGKDNGASYASVCVSTKAGAASVNFGYTGVSSAYCMVGVPIRPD